MSKWTDEVEADWHGEIEALARSVESECREHGREPGEVIHETIDSHRWVIYTGAAEAVIHNASSAVTMEALEDAGTPAGWGELVAFMAFHIMRDAVSAEVDEDACEPLSDEVRGWATWLEENASSLALDDEGDRQALASMLADADCEVPS